jgi:ferredoxin, 2Fe-2S
VVKKLTIGSLKPNNNPSHSRVQSIVITKGTLKELKRILEIQQNHSQYKIEVEKNQSILEAALSQGVGLEYKCQKGTCGRCKVKILNGGTYLLQANHLEEKKLEKLIQNGFRLACQARAK